jgi:hypothetical protein
MTSRARIGESSANSCENFTFQGQTDWEMCRYTRFEVALGTGLRTLNPASPPTGAAGPRQRSESPR